MDEGILVSNLREEIKILHEIIKNSEKQIVNYEETIKIAQGLISAQGNLIDVYKNLTKIGI